MKVGVYQDGRPLTYDEGSGEFRVGDVPVSISDVHGWDAAAQIAWESDALRDWARDLVGDAAPAPVQAPVKKPGRWASLPTAAKVAIVAGAVILLGMAASTGSGASDDAATKSSSSQATTVDSTSASTSATTGSNDAATEPATDNSESDSVDTASTDAPTLSDALDSAFGTFSTISKSGRGDGVVKLPSGGLEYALVQASHKGSSNFVIESLDESNDAVDLLVNEIGKYSGTTFLSADSGTPVKLKVTANGSWKVKILPVSTAKTFASGTSGKRDAVVLYTGPAADFKITHKGKSNFVVRAISGDGDDLLVNEIGKYSGTVPVSSGPALIIINADGSWKLTAE